MKVHPLITLFVAVSALTVSILSYFKASESLNTQKAGQRPRISVIEESLTDLNSGKLELLFAFKNVGLQPARDVSIRLLAFENEVDSPSFDDRIEAVNDVHPDVVKVANIPVDNIKMFNHLYACVSYSGSSGVFRDYFAYSLNPTPQKLNKFGVFSNMKKGVFERLKARRLCD